jgi:hypothetical protein
MSPAGNSHSNNHPPHQEQDSDNDDSMSDSDDKRDDNSHNDIPPLSQAASDGSDEEGSDPVMISPSSSPEKEASDAAPTNDDDDDASNTAERFEDPLGETVIPAPPSFIATGLQRKASPWKLTSWIALSLTLDGRDKITKTLQYLSRMLGWWFLAMGAKNASSRLYGERQSMRFTALYKALANARKAFRLGRSVTEAHKIASMGLVSLLCWHLKQQIDRLHGDDEGDGFEVEHVETKDSHKPPRTIVRRASSNIGWGPMTLDDDRSEARPSLVRSLSSMAYRKMYRPMLSQMSSTLASSSARNRPSVEWWDATGSALKMLGLLGFWLGDNVNFCAESGALDNYTLNKDDRLARRKQWQTFASNNANRAYFFGAVAGLLTNAYAYHRFRKDRLTEVEQEYMQSFEDHHDDEKLEKEEQAHALRKLKKIQAQQFSLFLALLKSCADVTVFSNNPGIDLHKKYRGKKNHEGLHCLCGLISAGTVLYNNFPDASKA